MRAPEWQALLSQSPVQPAQTSQPQSWILRSRLISILADLPSLIKAYSTMFEDQHRPGWDDKAFLLMLESYTKFQQVQNWLMIEAEPLFLMHGPFSPEQIHYSDIISGALDCVANTALLTLSSILRSLSGSRQIQPETEVYLEDPDIMENQGKRAMAALEFVRGESVIAAKPLEFGLQQVQANGLSCVADARAIWEENAFSGVKKDG